MNDIEHLVTWVTLIGGVIAVVVTVMRYVRPRWAALADFLDDWKGAPPRPGYEGRPSFPERLAEVEKAANQAAFNTGPNHGTSPYDDMMAHLRVIERRIVELERSSEFLTDELEKNHPDTDTPN